MEAKTERGPTFPEAVSQEERVEVEKPVGGEREDVEEHRGVEEAKGEEGPQPGVRSPPWSPTSWKWPPGTLRLTRPSSRWSAGAGACVNTTSSGGSASFGTSPASGSLPFGTTRSYLP